MLKHMTILTIAATSTILAFGLPAAIAQRPAIDMKGVTRKLIAEHIIDGPLTELNGKYKVTVAHFITDVGGYVGPHHHAGPGFRCVIEGEVTSEEEDGTVGVYKTGDCFWESGIKSHIPRTSGDKPSVGLVFEILPVSHTGPSLLPVPPR